MGNCWFADSINYVNTPNDEIEALRLVDLHNVAVIDTSVMKGISSNFSPTKSSVGESIELTKYQPNKIIYDSNLEHDRLAVFSEVYYPHGWHLYILNNEGKRETELPIVRANYILRAAIIPSGSHTLEMVFEPEAVRKGNILSLVCFGIFCLTTIGVLVMYYKKKRF